MSDTAQGSRVGTQFGHYHLKRLLGRGGMGEVYEAEDTVKDRVVALKLMSAVFSQDPVFRKRMQREARTAGRLQEPHVVPIHDWGDIDGQLYVDMRLIEGTDLFALLKRFGPLTPPRAVAIIHQIASALDAAHAAGVMHRDIKPENILVTRDDFAYLVDFGIASATTDEKLTQLGSAVGTWKYMAPERFSGDEVTYRADIYALACVLHECLTGSPPFRADSASVLVTAHLMEPIPKPSELRPGIPKALDDVIARGMAKKPEDRYASAGDLALAAHAALSTPDQDQTATLLRRSQEAATSGPTPTPAPTWSGPQPTQTPAPSWSGPQPTTTPPPTWSGPQPTTTPPPSWSEPQPTTTPVPFFNQPQQSSTSAPNWNQAQPSTTPPPNWSQPQPSMTPPNWNQPKKRGRGKWIVLAGLGLAALIAIVVVVVLVVIPSPPPPLPLVKADQLDSMLLNGAEVNDIMGATNMRPDKLGREPADPTVKLSNPNCVGALYAGEKPTYADSDLQQLRYMVFSEPGDNNDHFVDQDVALFKTAEAARAFVQASANQWDSCATQTVTVTHNDNTTSTWQIGNLTGDVPKITQIDTQQNTNNWKCQRALSAVSNVVFDVNACGYGITNEASQIADRMSTRVTERG
ncbi:sensor domain-containing protein [Mycobacterium fragae]|uniref:non-specific serine/threonine protein kinase n=1 Tax=Mycobacterium fragae TaxID=1260918 RepID=A0A1X1V6K8_9MYCO|nr:serine/threonine-protein kinase PknH/PknJ [Mycobacterium fragae]MCV7399381.1 sensor domain-containing protein [Mycobacterium fragae]ORV64681.1 serine/threonine protein kinase [Mycobacterium fragae]